MFFYFFNNGLFIGGYSGVLYQGLMPYAKQLSVSSQNNIKYFFNLKTSIKIFKNLLISFTKTLQLGCFLEILINGIGYKCWRFQNKHLLFNLGYSHFIYYKNIFNIFFRITRYAIKCFSLNIYLLGLMVSEIISLRKVDYYKGKGLRLLTKEIILKAGKQR